MVLRSCASFLKQNGEKIDRFLRTFYQCSTDNIWIVLASENVKIFDFSVRKGYWIVNTVEPDLTFDIFRWKMYKTRTKLYFSYVIHFSHEQKESLYINATDCIPFWLFFILIYILILSGALRHSSNKNF